MGLTYKDAGVDIEAGDKFVENIKKAVRSTYIKGVLGDIGGFGGLFELAKYNNPVLVSGTDGVGTKLKVAFLMDKHDTIGIDAVAMCVNDIVVTGAKPLFFLDYFAIGRLEPHKNVEVVKGMAEGCKQAGCALIGGETAEMPGFYAEGEYDIAGFSVGVVEKANIIDGTKIREGDAVVGIASSGLHSNGFSLVRKVFFEKAGYKVDKYIGEFGKTLGEELLTPTKIYVKDIFSVLDNNIEILAMAHITGGGLIENPPRMISGELDIVFDKTKWDVPPVFKMIQEISGNDETEMMRAFNMGIGMALVVKSEDASKVVDILNKRNAKAAIVGEIKKGTRKSVIK